jgi:hypothetical protein
VAYLEGDNLVFNISTSEILIIGVTLQDYGPLLSGDNLVAFHYLGASEILIIEVAFGGRGFIKGGLLYTHSL